MSIDEKKMNVNKKVLLVEDEIKVVEFIKKGLEEGGYDVSVALDGNTALNMTQNTAYDLIILDIMLPDKNGIDVCKELRLRNYTFPILFLTALGTSENIALGLDTGADDYLVKPFKFIELNARINALLRRSIQMDELSIEQNKQVYIVGDLVVNDDAKTVSRKETLISLTATEYRLLLVLVKSKGKVLSRIDILESAWDINFNMETNVVDVYINYLRKKIDADYEPKLIHTIVGMGYVLKLA